MTEVSWIQIIIIRPVQTLSLRKSCEFDSKICICHSGSSSAGLLLFIWKTFLNAAVEGSDGRFSDITGPPQGAYHNNAIKHTPSNRILKRVKTSAAVDAIEACSSAVPVVCCFR